MMDNERLAIVETKVGGIQSDVSEIKVMLTKHIEGDTEKLTKTEAYKAFAPMSAHKEVDRIRGTITRVFWWGLGAVGTIAGLVVAYFIRTG